MLRERIIPCLLLRGSGFVKTKRFRDARYIGDAINALRIFNDKAADEIIIVDIDASVKGYAPRVDMIQQLTSELFVPLTYGGGITTIDQVDAIIACGVEKIAINTRNASNLELTSEASRKYGAQAVVGVVDVDRNLIGRRNVICRSGKQRIKGSPVQHAQRLEKAGAGEVLLQAVYLDGVKSGYDLDLIREVRDAVTVPVVALGGAGSIDDMADVITSGGASAAAAGSIFIFHGMLDGILINMPDEQERIRAFENARKSRGQ